MDRAAVDAKIRELAEPFNKKGIEIKEDTTFANDLEFDSLTVMDFVAEIEDSALIKALGRDGRGIFAMPSSLSRDIREQYHVLKVSPPMDIEVQTFAITSASSRQNKAVRHLLDVHEERAPADGA